MVVFSHLKTFPLVCPEVDRSMVDGLYPTTMKINVFMTDTSHTDRVFRFRKIGPGPPGYIPPSSRHSASGSDTTRTPSTSPWTVGEYL